MRSALRLAAALLALTGALCSARGEERRSPAELVRALQRSQDQVAAGSAEAQRAQRTLLPQIAAQLLQAEPEAWKEPRNACAVVAFVLSGGDVRVLKKVLSLGVLPGMNEKVVVGVLAYGDGRDADAAALLVPVNARTLDPSIAGNVAFVQAELVAKKDPKKALGFLDDARLLAPGTLVEEAALRRQVAIVAATGNFDRFEMLSTNYLRRFPRSAYAAAFRRQFAADVAAREDSGDAGRMARMAVVLEALGVAERRDAYLSIAQEGLARGKLELARFAAGAALSLAEDSGAERLRAELYAAAAQVAGSGFADSASALEAMGPSQLVDGDAELLTAARSVAAEVGRLPALAEAGPSPEDIGATVKAAERARQAMARVDDIIATASK